MKVLFNLPKLTVKEFLFCAIQFRTTMKLYTQYKQENHEGTGQTVSWPHVIVQQNWISRNLLDSHALIHTQKMIAEEVFVESDIYPMECYLILSKKE